MPYTHKELYKVANLYLTEGLTYSEVAKRLNKKAGSVQHMLRVAREMGVIQLNAPQAVDLRDQLHETYPETIDRATVIDPVEDLGSPVDPTDGGEEVKFPDPRHPGSLQGEAIAAATAHLVLDLIREVGSLRWRQKKPVTLGLGPGRATRDFCRYLALGLAGARSDDDVVRQPIKLVAISAGCPATQPQFASSSFFNMFWYQPNISFLGLFANSLMKQREYKENIYKIAGIKEAMNEKENIDIVVTSMGDIADPHDLLRQFFMAADQDVEKLIKSGWKGNVQYRPYSDVPLLQKPEEYRAVTVFELADLCDMAAHREKHVVLIARRCSHVGCSLNRGDALRPLLTEPKLKVWSHILLDVPTAQSVLKPSAPPPPPAGARKRP